MLSSFLIWTVGTSHVYGPEPSYEDAVARVERLKSSNVENAYEYEIVPSEFSANSSGRTQEEK